ncbi:hypothetical protein AQPE_3143 [Aquipluma nitroreducens]|uniref:Lipoprotein n=1 Tax=Aquipluma nitroreducens TaxID=2010828 RepID=A0A5K7SBN5_9BACT|nr:hypothetical protein [Aquipluma nitroreducens]BBE18970.1 hypothetical protein AQPE_3143 [Aquipluma nitroreducens]
MKKFISILLCYCILILPTGCHTSKLLTADEAEAKTGTQNYLILHTPNRNYKIFNYKFTKDSIEGDLRILSPGKSKTINLYTEMNFDIKLSRDSSEFVRISKADITKITYKEFSMQNTIIAVVGVLGVFAILSVIVANSMSFNIDLSGMSN